MRILLVQGCGIRTKMLAMQITKADRDACKEMQDGSDEKEIRQMNLASKQTWMTIKEKLSTLQRLLLPPPRSIVCFA
jgi:hypothetical protein